MRRLNKIRKHGISKNSLTNRSSNTRTLENKKPSKIREIITDSDILKNSIRELINIHSKKSLYKGIPNIKQKLMEAVVSNLSN
tara:strand:+ start:200 stop:448 length:249 start_codon:yes stop_codon:yes gene_type:complete